ncbi:MAG: M20/M25/M40 family metallo-hydrolase [Gemmatimonadota bacterium]
MQTIDELVEAADVRAARRVVRETDTDTLRHMAELVEIPAPPFGEEARGEYVLDRFRELGLHDVHRDEAGNVLGTLPGAAEPDAGPVMVAAHLDTVFDEQTDVRLRREGDRWCAPGISDNVRGLAAMLALARGCTEAGVRTRRPLVLVASVGEEGIGDLRGVKHIFRSDGPWLHAAAFLAIDGAGMDRIIDRGVGSRRYHIDVRGEGGHSWSDWGIANPVHAIGNAIAELMRLRLRHTPRTVLSVTRVGGGTSVNAVPQAAWLELDLRSESERALARLDRRVQAIVRRAVGAAARRRRRGTAGLDLDVRSIGQRPAGRTRDETLLLAAAAATRAVGAEPEGTASSTDANVAMALGIPALCVGAGGRAGGMHTTDEWYTNERGPEGIERVLLIVLAAAGLAPSALATPPAPPNGRPG